MAASKTGRSKDRPTGTDKPRSAAGDTKPGSTQPAAKPRSPRRRAREYVLQGLYAWQMTHGSAADIEAGFAGEQSLDKAGFGRADKDMFSALLAGTIREAADLQVVLQPALDRKFEELSPVERATIAVASRFPA